MKFLCLHGASTNSEIFEIQTGGLRQQLSKKGHTFKFMNGRLASPVEGELEGVVDGPFFNHYDRDTSPGATVGEAIEHTQRFIEEQGPFDAVMGFSQGAALAAAMIIEHAKTHPGQPPLFRAAVFLCGASPWESSGLMLIHPTPDTYPINIPTANVVGRQDPIYEASMKLYGLCEPSKAMLYDHGSRHMIPFDMKHTEGMIKVIEDTIAKAVL
ncbi:uncharacterized protein N7483_004260 [Penicillium malachiteum]|uniref:uncharacterized protein n=1 Tax=Penicillium malachiteum TaxID=1324776 RepID=UPI0025491D85|nr:uncharacterized protein N7483_004260 [Penicillium malachiteum]KAJ5729752.1 hypothetical protein N7483_004260 [Penicillium malachiteum]